MRVVLVGAELEENLALAYLRGALEAEGHRVNQVSFNNAADLERASEQIARSDAQLAGLSMVFTSRAKEFARLASRSREKGFGGLTIAGGHFAAFHAQQLLEDVPALDAVAVGEGEQILCDMARSPGDLRRVPGLVWRHGATIRRNPAAVPEQELDRLPWPARQRPFGAYLGLPIANMLSSRGCTHACAFCSIAAWHKLCGGARYRARTPEAIAAEMGCLWREGVRLFNFHDDNFIGRNRDENLKRAFELRDALAHEGVGKLAFQIKARPDSIDPELFALLRSMGLFRVFLGIEAGTELSLKHLGRGQRLADNVRALNILNELDLHVAFNLLLLNPDSTLEDFAENVAFLRQHPCNPLNFCRTEVYAGTPLERRLRAQGRLHGDYWGLDYTISDEQAQRAFELIRLAFHDRNFGANPLHYLSGRVDYEHQIRADLLGTTAELKASAKRFVRAVNENTVSHLEAIVAAIVEGRATDSFGSELAWRVARDDVRLLAEGEAVLARIRALHRSAKPSKRSRAALAASVALALASCSNTTQHYEAAPQPTCDGKNASFGQPYQLYTHASWISAAAANLEGPRLDASPKIDARKADAASSRDATRSDAGALRVRATITINANTWEKVSFKGAPSLTGGQIVSIQNQGFSQLTFDFVPNAGTNQVQAVINIDCGAFPNVVKLGFDVSAPAEGKEIPVSRL